MDFALTPGFAQIAIISDTDGHTNLRIAPDGQSAIIYQVPDGHAFFYNYDDIAAKRDWVEIFVAKDPFSLGAMESGDLVGYVHRSRVVLHEDLEKF